MLTKQAKTLSDRQIKTVLMYIQSTRHPVRNKLIFLLSIKAGLRAKEIAGITWRMVCDEGGLIGDCLRIEDKATKGRSGGIIPLSKDLRSALTDWRSHHSGASLNTPVIITERSSKTSSQVIVNMFADWYSALGFGGCSSHSGRRTFITCVARKISSVGGSMRDVQALARHSSLAMTQRYIDVDNEAQRKVVELI